MVCQEALGVCVCVYACPYTHTHVLAGNRYCLSKVLEGSYPVGGDLKDAETTTGGSLDGRLGTKFF